MEEMAEKTTEKITIWGIVQGVGFRPFVAKLAHRMEMRGEVLNKGGLVELVVTDSPKKIDEFLRALKSEKPLPAEIVHIKREPLSPRFFSDFKIQSSVSGMDEIAMIPPDLALCSKCEADLLNPENPRYNHPFISCMACGPRYTIMDRLPYDRENTAMVDWPMCDFCLGEYKDKENRRYHAQTISCHNCGPVLLSRQSSRRVTGPEKKFEPQAVRSKDFIESEILNTLSNGGVIAVKGVGGYHLMCDPFIPEAVEKLRLLKDREAKPFAVLFRDLDQVEKFCFINPVEKGLLTSSARPILLLEHREAASLSQAELNPPREKEGFSISELERSRFIGSFLPSTALQIMILDLYGGPLIATSANLSGAPMIKDEEEIFALQDKYPHLLSGVYYHLRDIRLRVDDSVVRVIDGQPQMIRRSKGYAPLPLSLATDLDSSSMILAVGGQLKNSFALTKGPFAYVSEYFGDLDESPIQETYEESLERMQEFFHIKPGLVVCDLHPLYHTTSFAEAYSKKYGIPLLKVQHHHAHVASVMAEHHLEGPVIGVSFDGTGYGTDGSIWGGEFLLCENGDFRRMAHLPYIKVLGGDESMKDARKSALCYLYDSLSSTADSNLAKGPMKIDLSQIIEYSRINNILGLDPGFHNGQAPETANQAATAPINQGAALVFKALDLGINTFNSSSCGRLFDAVAALLGICSYNTYEGQCAILLEDAADRALKGKGTEADELALDFHLQMARLILNTCLEIRRETGANQVALTGGVFQNRILTEESLRLLRDNKFSVYYNVSVSPNDGGLALGQAYLGMKYTERNVID